MNDDRPFAERWYDDCYRVVAEAFAEAIARGDLEVADRWAKSVMYEPPTPAEMQEQDA